MLGTPAPDSPISQKAGSSDPVIEGIRALHARLRKDLDIAEANVSEEEERLLTAIAKCATDRATIQQKREALAQIEAMYRPLFENSDFLSPSQAAEMRALDRLVGLSAPNVVSVSEQIPAKKPQTKARIGDQRYRMFVCLSGSKEYTDMQVLSVITGVTERRVRDQMAEDTANGFVQTAPEGEKYLLTEQGEDLLARFIASRTARGIPLPSNVAPPTDDDASQGADDDTDQGDME
jgi:hypothetical protein